MVTSERQRRRPRGIDALKRLLNVSLGVQRIHHVLDGRVTKVTDPTQPECVNTQLPMCPPVPTRRVPNCPWPQILTPFNCVPAVDGTPTIAISVHQDHPPDKDT